MSNSLQPIDPLQLAMINGAGGKTGLSLPFSHEIMLVNCHVAGTFYCYLKDIEPFINPSDTLILKREPENLKDALAILVLNQNGNKLGYIPRETNEILARLMDAGKLIYAKVEAKEWSGAWLKIDIQVFLKEI